MHVTVTVATPPERDAATPGPPPHATPRAANASTDDLMGGCLSAAVGSRGRSGAGTGPRCCGNIAAGVRRSQRTHGEHRDHQQRGDRERDLDTGRPTITLQHAVTARSLAGGTARSSPTTLPTR